MAIQYVILVAGYDYVNKGKANFEELCMNRMKRILNKHKRKDTELRFVLFDLKSGKLKLSFINPGRKRIWTTLKQFKPVTKENYDGRNFTKDKSGVMSITDVYEYILELARDEPKTIVELSILTHGWPEGPVLVNSEDRYPDAKKRDPEDKDARRKDFEPENLKDVGKMKLAFAPDATIWSWGCNVEEIYKQVLHQILDSYEYKKTPPGMLRDDSKFFFKFDKKWAKEHYPEDSTFFPYEEWLYQLDFERNMEEIKEFLTNGLKDTYCSKIAKAMGVKCYGALPGMYTTYEKPKSDTREPMFFPPDVSLPLMVIPQSIPPFTNNFSRHIRFYTLYMGIVIDPEKRGYARFDP